MTNHYSGSVTPVTVATNTAKPPVEAGAGPGNIAITLDGKTAYVGDTGPVTGDPATVTPITIATSKAQEAIMIGTGPGDLALAITPLPKR